MNINYLSSFEKVFEYWHIPVTCNIINSENKHQDLKFWLQMDVVPKIYKVFFVMYRAVGCRLGMIHKKHIAVKY